jgi:hypothetical protein
MNGMVGLLGTFNFPSVPIVIFSAILFFYVPGSGKFAPFCNCILIQLFKIPVFILLVISQDENRFSAGFFSAAKVRTPGGVNKSGIKKASFLQEALFKLIGNY